MVLLREARVHVPDTRRDHVKRYKRYRTAVTMLTIQGGGEHSVDHSWLKIVGKRLTLKIC